MEDPDDLKRFISAQQAVYSQALAEIQRGEKRTHWMWFIFPQIVGLGNSPTARYYAVRGPNEVSRYLLHPVLGTRLIECTRAVLALEGRSMQAVFGSPDDLKLKSCMTLFETAAGEPYFTQVLQKHYGGERDTLTLDILDSLRTVR
jgi:uncharacterized protein (DUF1810 family)